MIAKILSAEKQYVNGELMIVTRVSFDGVEQVYGQKPEDVDPAYFQRQADVMQADVDDTARKKKLAEATAHDEAKADEALSKVHKLMLGDAVEIKEEIKK